MSRPQPLSGHSSDSDAALYVCAWLLGYASEYEGDPEATCRALVGHARGERYPFAPSIAQDALNYSTGVLHYAVAQAIMALRIELPV